MATVPTTITNTNTSNPLAQYQAGATKPSTSAGDAALDKLTSDYTTFLKLLTTQLQNQDPTSPMDSAQFTQQLVQYSQVEQQIKSNQKLDAIINGQANAGVGSSLGYLGKIIEMDSAAFTTTDTGGSFNYTLSDVADTVTVKIFNESGTLVRTAPGASGTLGKHTINWDGKNDDGKALPPGLYSVGVTATKSSGVPVSTKVSTNGRVDGVEKDASGAVVLNVGKMQIATDKILAIHDTPVATTSTASTTTPTTTTNTTNSDKFSTFINSLSEEDADGALGWLENRFKGVASTASDIINTII
ncbi:MAG: flagellar hook assembly protein FlgD [Alphaproteobacteria bacterium]|nr:flagellar hook assembly protein FlgD [Alphaproteobacteria bacterium]